MKKKQIVREAPIDYGDRPERMSPDIERTILSKGTPLSTNPAFPNIEQGNLPETFEEYAFLSYDCKPMQTKYLSGAEVLKFRDEAWQKYFTHQPFLSLVEKKFGEQSRKNVEEMAQIKLKRKILGD